MGCSILHALACRGLKKAILLESEILSFGSTGKSQGILRIHYSNELTSRMTWESLKVFKFFDEVVGGDSGYVKAGYLLISGQGQCDAMEENVAMHKKIGFSTEMISSGRVRDIAPAFSVEDKEVCAYEPESGYADPYLVNHGYATAAKKLGAEIHVSTPVEKIEVNGGKQRQGVWCDDNQQALFRHVPQWLPPGHGPVLFLNPWESYYLWR
mgnify:CR=1 FL=1